jgi:hypothetical protein
MRKILALIAILALSDVRRSASSKRTSLRSLVPIYYTVVTSPRVQALIRWIAFHLQMMRRRSIGLRKEIEERRACEIRLCADPGEKEE